MSILNTSFVLLVSNLKNEWYMIWSSLESDPFDNHILKNKNLIDNSTEEDLFPRHLWSSYINEFNLVYYFR